MPTITPLQTGTVTVDRATAYKEKNPLAPTGIFRPKSKQITLPVFAYLIQTDDGKNVLVDTGWSKTYSRQHPKRFFGLMDHISHPELKESQSVVEQLARMGLKPSDLDAIVFTHLDFDHTSGLEDLKGARRVLASQQEIEDAARNPFRYDKNTWKDFQLEPIHFEKTGTGPAGESKDLFQDGVIELVHTPGHSNGSTSVLVKNPETGKYAAITGDVFYTQRNLDENLLQGYTTDDASANASREYAKQMRSDPECKAVLATHDPSVQKEKIQV